MLIFTRTWLRYVRVFAIANPSVCSLSSVCNVYAPYSGGWNFRHNFFAAVYLSHPLISVQNFAEIIPEETPRRDVKRKRGSKIERWWSWTYRKLYFINGTRMTLRRPLFQRSRSVSVTETNLVKSAVAPEAEPLVMYAVAEPTKVFNQTLHSYFL